MLLAKVGIFAILLTVAGIYVHEYIPLIAALGGVGFMGFIFNKARQKTEHLSKKYKLVMETKNDQGN